MPHTTDQNAAAAPNTTHNADQADGSGQQNSIHSNNNNRFAAQPQHLLPKNSLMVGLPPQPHPNVYAHLNHPSLAAMSAQRQLHAHQMALQSVGMQPPFAAVPQQQNPHHALTPPGNGSMHLAAGRGASAVPYSRSLSSNPLPAAAPGARMEQLLAKTHSGGSYPFTAIAAARDGDLEREPPTGDRSVEDKNNKDTKHPFSTSETRKTAGQNLSSPFAAAMASDELETASMVNQEATRNPHLPEVAPRQPTVATALREESTNKAVAAKAVSDSSSIPNGNATSHLMALETLQPMEEQKGSTIFNTAAGSSAKPAARVELPAATRRAQELAAKTLPTSAHKGPRKHSARTRPAAKKTVLVVKDGSIEQVASSSLVNPRSTKKATSVSSRRKAGGLSMMSKNVDRTTQIAGSSAMSSPRNTDSPNLADIYCFEDPSALPPDVQKPVPKPVKGPRDKQSSIGSNPRRGDSAKPPSWASSAPHGYPPVKVTAEQIKEAIPENASSIFHILDRRVNLDAFPPDASLYSLLRAWVQDDPYRQVPPTGSNLLEYVSLPSERRDVEADVKPDSSETDGQGEKLETCDVFSKISNSAEMRPSIYVLRSSHTARAKRLRERKRKQKAEKDAISMKRLESLGINLRRK